MLAAACADIAVFIPGHSAVRVKLTASGYGMALARLSDITPRSGVAGAQTLVARQSACRNTALTCQELLSPCLYCVGIAVAIGFIEARDAVAQLLLNSSYGCLPSWPGRSSVYGINKTTAYHCCP